MREENRAHFGVELLIFTFAAIFIFFRLGSAPVYETTEARYADTAREMLESRNFLVPYENYSPHLTKPPLSYWLAALGLRIFGVNEFGVRFFNSLLAALLVVVVYFFARAEFGVMVGRSSAILLVLSPLFFGMGRTLSTDVPLTLFVVASFLGFIRGMRTGRGGWFTIAWLTLGVSMLAKQVVAPALVLGPLLIYVLVFRQLELLPRLFRLRDIAVFAIVGFSWYAVASLREPALLVSANEVGWHLFVGNIGLFRQPYMPALVLVGGAFPASIYASLALKGLSSRSRFELTKRQTLWLLLFWVGLGLAIFSVAATKRVNYLLPLVPPTAILGGVGLGAALENASQSRSSRKRGVFLVPAVLAMVAGLLVSLAPNRYLPGGFAFGPLERALGAIGFSLALLSLVLLLRGNFRLHLAFLGAGLAVLVFTGGLLIDQFKASTSSKALVAKMKEMGLTEMDIVCWRRLRTALPFYLGKRIVTINWTPDTPLPVGKDYPAHILFTEDALLEMIWSGRKIVIVAAEKDAAWLEKNLSDAVTFDKAASLGKSVLLIPRLAASGK